MKRWRNLQRAAHYKRRRNRWKELRRHLKPVTAEQLPDIHTILKQLNNGELHHDH